MPVNNRVHRPSAARAVGAARSVRALVLAGVAAAAVLTGCSMEEAVCGGGEYPVLSVGGTGSACVPNGEEPPDGYTRYPEGRVPEHVGDKWDTYWQTHTVDENGKVVRVPEGG
ncbi:SCO0607 family lipoprotein [Streptomyces coelicoflavus]|uniref:SCO0607 family lipoprotein n=1 Tax=Streptomyces coelicoflavus TaxID=285562 RepID=UPI002E256928